MERKLRIFLIWFWILLGISLLVTIGFFLSKFHSAGLSGEPANWGTFGDYFGGITQSIFAFANLIIFVKLTILLAAYQKTQSSNELDLQKRIVLTQLKSDVVKNISDKLNSFFEIIKDSSQKRLDLINLAGQVDSFSKHNSHLFAGLTNNSDIAKSLIEIANCYKINYGSEEEKIQDLKIKVTQFYSERDKFIQGLHVQILDAIK